MWGPRLGAVEYVLCPHLLRAHSWLWPLSNLASSLTLTLAGRATSWALGATGTKGSCAQTNFCGPWTWTSAGVRVGGYETWVLVG